MFIIIMLLLVLLFSSRSSSSSSSSSSSIISIVIVIIEGQTRKLWGGNDHDRFVKWVGKLRGSAQATSYD